MHEVGLIEPPGASLSSEVRGMLSRLRIAPRKGLGQHFLVDRRVLERILQAAELGPQDLVLEVGPGVGILTRELALRAGKVIAIEMDSELAEALSREFKQLANLTVVCGDAREVGIGPFVGEAVSYKVVANLPYYAASPIVRRFLEAPKKPSLMVVMVQKEVAQSMAAEPGDMSLLSVATQFYGRPRIVSYVSPGAFYPRPKVTSAIVRIDVYDTPPVPVTDESAFFDVVRAGFSAPRKQLRNSLAQGLRTAPVLVEELLQAASVDFRRRAETLALEEWARVYQVCSSRDISPNDKNIRKD